MANFKKFLMGSLTGAFAGIVAAYLFAPHSGQETRRQIQAKADEIKLEFDLASQEKRDELENEVRQLRGES